jgi:hypothetical protein
MDVLTQEEITALLEAATEDLKPEKKSSATKASAPTYKFFIKKTNSNIIASKDFDAAPVTEPSKEILKLSERYIKSTKVKLQSRLKRNVPFLELLQEYGNGPLKKGSSLELSTNDGSVISGSFEGFFYEGDQYDGGILINSGEKTVPVNAKNIAINTKGFFIISYSNDPNR